MLTAFSFQNFFHSHVPPQPLLLLILLLLLPATSPALVSCCLLLVSRKKDTRRGRTREGDCQQGQMIYEYELCSPRFLYSSLEPFFRYCSLALAGEFLEFFQPLLYLLLVATCLGNIKYAYAKCSPSRLRHP